MVSGHKHESSQTKFFALVFYPHFPFYMLLTNRLEFSYSAVFWISLKSASIRDWEYYEEKDSRLFLVKFMSKNSISEHSGDLERLPMNKKGNGKKCPSSLFGLICSML